MNNSLIDFNEPTSNRNSTRINMPNNSEISNAAFDHAYHRRNSTESLDCLENLHTRSAVAGSDTSLLAALVQQQSEQLKMQQQQIQQLLNLIPTMKLNQPSTSVMTTFQLPNLENLLPEFSGNRDEDPSEFIQKFEQITTTYNIPEHMWKSLVISQLKGNAKAWIDRNSAHLDSYKAFTQALRNTYENHQQLTKLRAEFYGNSQIAGEGSENFVNEKIKIYKRIFPNNSEEQRLQDITELLHPQVRAYLLTKVGSIEELLAKLNTIDAALNWGNTFKEPENCNSQGNWKNRDGQNFPQKNSRSNWKNHSHPNNSKPEWRNNSKQDWRNYAHQTDSRNNSSKPVEGRNFHNPRDNDWRGNSSYNNWKKPNFQPQFTNERNIEKPSNFQNMRNQDSSQKDTSSNIPRKHVGHMKINSFSNIDGPNIILSIDGRNTTAFLDTGANGCFIHPSLISNPELVTEEKEEVKLAETNTTRVCPSIQLQFTIGNNTLSHKFYILPHLITPILLGYDWLKENRAIIDASNNLLFYGKQQRHAIPLHSNLVSRTPIQNTNHIDNTTVEHNFPEKYIPEFEQLLHDFSNLFQTNPLQQTVGEVHRIELLDKNPIYVPQYKLSPPKEAYAKQQIEFMLEQNLIEESISPYNAPIVVVDKEDKEMRFCTDYKKLNKVTKDSYCPSLNISNMVKNIGNNNYFCKLDLKKGYWQVPLDENSKELTAFTGPDGRHWQYRVMPFGLKGAPATFMKLMFTVLQNYLNDVADVFLDDVIVKAQDYETLLKNLRLVFERFSIFNLTLSIDKCQFGVTDLIYLGHNIMITQNFASNHHITAIQGQKYPKTKKELQSFIGLCTWLRDYAIDAATVLEPLYNILTRKPFKWNDSDNIHMDRAKETFSNLQPLHRPDPDLKFIVQTDGSILGLGACLYQEDTDGNKRIISNISTTLNDTQKKYHSNEIECMAVVWALKKFKIYLEGKKFTVRTDNKALVWLKDSKEEKSKFYRWSLFLQEMNFDVEHVPGRENQLADALSRYPVASHMNSLDEEKMYPPYLEENSSDQRHLLNIQVQNLEEKTKKQQEEDTESQKLISNYQEILNTSENMLETRQKRFLEVYQVLDGYLYFKHKGEDWKIYVPHNSVEMIIHYYHSNSLYCHPGVDATCTLITQYFDWPKLRKDVTAYIKHCDVCIRVKVAGRIKTAPLQPRIEEEKLRVWSIDIMGPYTPTRKGKNKYIITLTEPCSKWTEAKAVRKADASTILKFLHTEIFTRYGFPETVLTDNGSQFLSKQWTEYCQKHDINHLTTAVYSPRQNPVEQKNYNLKTRIRAQLLDTTHDRWDEGLPEALFSMRSTTNSATKHSPAEILFGQNLRSPGEPLTNVQIKPKFTAHEEANKNQVQYNNKNYNNTKTFKLYSENTTVFIKNHSLSDAAQGIVASFNPYWIGPYRIIKTFPSGVYLCESIDDPTDTRKIKHGDIQVVNENILETHHQETTNLNQSISNLSLSSETSEEPELPSTEVLNITSKSGRKILPNQKYYGNVWVNDHNDL